MSEKIIEIIVDEEGKVHIETFGFEGKSCIEATEDFIKALGGVVCREKKKPEYWKEVNQKLQLSRVLS